MNSNDQRLVTAPIPLRLPALLDRVLHLDLGGYQGDLDPLRLLFDVFSRAHDLGLRPLQLGPQPFGFGADRSSASWAFSAWICVSLVVDEGLLS